MSRRYTVIWANTAYADLLDIVEYIAKDSPATAGKILQNWMLDGVGPS